ncbi:MAG TPA: hypothetical protein VF111_11055 [Thermoanaerobaculia bacterium]
MPARLRNAAVPPIAAFLLTHAYFSLSIALQFRFRFWIAAIVLAAGAILGTVRIVRVVRRERLRGVALGWLLLAVAAVWLCAQTFLGIAFPPR